MRWIITALLFAGCSGTLLAQQISQDKKLATVTFAVSGNCNMCKKRIEKPFKNLTGIHKASWDKKTKQFTVTYDSTLITERRIKEIIAEQGHDTDEIQASDETYSKLPKCCRYRENPSDH